MGIITAKIITPVGRSNPLADGHIGFKLRIQQFILLLRALIGGGIPRAGTGIVRGIKRAFGTLTLSSGSGTVGGVINGVALTATWATSDTVAAGLIVAAINASSDALVSGGGGAGVEAGQLAGTLTLSGMKSGLDVEVCGFRFRSVGTATPAGNEEFSIATSDTAAAASLAAAINKHPVASQFLCATNSAGVVTVWCTRATIPADFSNRLIGATGCTAGAAALAAGAVVYVTAYYPGTDGNAVTLAASGTGVTASGARLTGGTSSLAETP